MNTRILVRPAWNEIVLDDEVVHSSLCWGKPVPSPCGWIDSSPWASRLSIAGSGRGQVANPEPAEIVFMTVCPFDIPGIMREVLHVPRMILPSRVEQDDVVNPTELLAARTPRVPPPHDLVLEVRCAEDGVHDGFEIVAGSWVAVEIDAASRLEDPLHFEQTNRHHAEVRLHALSVGEACGGNRCIERGMLVRNQPHPCGVEVAERPSILERGPRGLASNRGAVVLVGVEGRVEVDEVDALRVEASEDVDVVPGEDRLVCEVHWHSGLHEAAIIPLRSAGAARCIR